MSLVSNKHKRVFLCLGSKINVKQKVDIILSPEFYWVRVFDIPVKNSTQARHVLPTLFEDVLETTTELSYQVLKLEDGKYLCFAYINKKIFEAIKSAGITSSQVNSIYFAQTECKNYRQFTSCNKSFLYTNDDILVKVPNALLSDKISLEEKLDEINLSSNKVDIKLYNSSLSSKQIYSLLAVMLIVCFVNIFKVIDYKNELANFENKIDETKKASKLPSSMIQTNSIIDSFKSKKETQIHLRESISYILKNKKTTLKSLNMKKRNFELEYINSSMNDIKSYLSKKFEIQSIRKIGNVIKVRLKV
ncbi:hypothetical protein ACH5BK_13930 [Arcobacter sp. YIC-80]|uniref:hypothetical protein n=1 Tax=Arcobacter sp. YIC-80 TaxID=3376683 RepID=UPI003850B918